ncbi:MAG TPA: glycosyltransferase [Proteobacteria bacterium]|nr:glycosyltransferase [Pseudomonadota bacterium]
MKILFAYNRPRNDVWRDVKAGLVPDELMFGLSHFRKVGVDAEFTDEIFEPTRLEPLFRLFERWFSRGGMFVGFSLGRALNIARLGTRYDLTVAWGDSTALPLLMLKRFGRFNKPVVYSTVGLAWLLDHRRWMIPFIRALVRRAEFVVHYGWGEGSILRERLALPKSKLKFIPFCVDIRFFTDLATGGIPSDGKILALGRDRMRDWSTLFEAVKGSGVGIRLVCPKEAIEHLDVPLEVDWSPEVPYRRLKELLGSAKAVVLPVVDNPYTAATITMLEAMAAGRAVVVSRTRAIGQGYRFEQNREIVFVEPGNPAALRDAIKRVAFDLDFCRRLGGRAREAMIERHSMRIWVDEWRRIFESCGRG